MTAPLYALLIGVDRYSHPDVPHLKGCANDVRAVRELLLGTLGVPPDHLLELVDARATRAAIVAAFETHLIARGAAWQAGGDDEPPAFLLYFSGHGSRARDVTGQEPDGYHETIVPHDARHEDVFDIRDLELAEWLARLPGDNITVILDCCHSGSGTRRGRRALARAAPPDERPQTDLIERRPRSPAGARARSVVTSGTSRHVLLAACSAEQEAYEYVGADGAARGAFTYFLVPELAGIGDRPTLTYRQLHERVRFPVNAARPGQTPQCEGDVDRVIFSRERRPWSVHAAVIGVRRERVWLDAGRVHGLTPGSRMALERPDGRSAIVALEHVEPVRSAGPVLGQAQLPERGTGAHLDTLDLGANRWRLHLTTRDDDPATGPLAAAMSSGPLAGLVTRTAARGQADLVVTSEGTTPVLADASGRRLVAGSDPLAFIPAVEHVARFAWLLRSERPTLRRDLPPSVRLRVKAVTTDAFGERQLDAVPANPDGDHEVAMGTPLAFALTNDYKVPLHAALVAFTSDWRVAVLFPTVRGAQDRLAPGITVTLGTGDLSFTASLAEQFDTGTDRLRLLATTRATSFDPLALEPPPARWSTAGPLPEPAEGRPTLVEPPLPPPRGTGVRSLWVTADAVLVTRRRR